MFLSKITEIELSPNKNYPIPIKPKKNKEIQRKAKKNKEIRRKTKNANDTGYFEKFRENLKMSRKNVQFKKNTSFIKKHIFYGK